MRFRAEGLEPPTYLASRNVVFRVRSLGFLKKLRLPSRGLCRDNIGVPRQVYT